MSTPRPRRWFQIHLSTAVILMVLASLLLWLNFRTVAEIRYSSDRAPYAAVHGWPIKAVFRFGRPILEADAWTKRGDEYMIGRLDFFSDFLVPNTLTALMILATVTIALEFLARRREARKP